MSRTYTISELAREFGVTTRTIRHYEELGLMAPLRRGQQRVYSAADRTRLKLILRGRRLGFSLEESHEIIDLYTPGKDNAQQLRRLLERIAVHRQRLLDQQRDIKQMLAEMDAVEHDCREAVKAGTASGAETKKKRSKQ